MLRRLASAGRASFDQFRAALFPRAALERAVYAHLQPLAAGRRVLHLCRGKGRAALGLHQAGAAEVVTLAPSPRDPHPLARPGLRFDDSARPSDDLGAFGLIADVAGLGRGGGGPSERPSPAFEWILERLAPGGQLAVALPPDASEAWRERLSAHFLCVEDLHLRGTEAGDLRFETEASGDTLCRLMIASAALHFLPAGPRRLHVGAGAQRLEGWINVDIRPFAGIDLVADVTRGLELDGIDAVFAEHFLEHLAVDHALDFLAACQRMLIEGGRLRLSTPNLDWVWQTHYRLQASPDDKVNAAIALNRAFHGWEHKFVWNRETLESALTAVGFRDLVWHRHGESDVEHLSGLERHETYDDDDDLRHVLIVEGVKGTPDAESLAALRERLQRDFLDHVAGY